GCTNAAAAPPPRQGEPEGIVLVADHQTAGRGRRSRTWVSPPGGSLLLSVLLRPPAGVAGAATMAAAAARPAGVAGAATRAAAVALAEAVEALAGVRAGLKWPNDLVVGRDDRK